MRSIPTPGPASAWAALRAWPRGRTLGALGALHAELGDVFRLPLPGFSGVMLVGPEANRLVLVEARDRLAWRAERDPVTQLLGQGLLVTDGPAHDALRARMAPALHRAMVERHVAIMCRRTDEITHHWGDGGRVDLFPAMRRVALQILMEALFHEDIAPDLARLWPAIMATLRYISPGLWLFWPDVPRPGYGRALREMDAYLYRLITRRRVRGGPADDLLGTLIAADLSDTLIRDQVLTLLIAGHDTSTALLSWCLYLLARHPGVLRAAQAEVRAVLADAEPAARQLRQLPYLEAVIKETLRLYPPIHLGSRLATAELAFRGYQIPSGTRVLYSPYLTHRDPRFWPDPTRFDPGRFSPAGAGERPSLAYVPFGGGPRNCIGAIFAMVEVTAVLARILQRYDLRLARDGVRPRMRATLEPHPGVWVEVRRAPQQTA